MKPCFCIVLSFLFLTAQAFAQLNDEDLQYEPTEEYTDPSEYVEPTYSENKVPPQQQFEENPKYNVREYDHKQQIIVGGVIMFCVALAMIASNNYNPKR